MRVSKNSDKAHIAGALTGSLRSGDTENLDIMGPIAAYIAIKAILLAQEFIKEDGLEMAIRLSKYTATLSDTGMERTVIRFTCIPVKAEEQNGEEEGR